MGKPLHCNEHLIVAGNKHRPQREEVRFPPGYQVSTTTVYWAFFAWLLLLNLQIERDWTSIRSKRDKRTVARLITGVSFEVFLDLILGYEKATLKKTWVDAITTMLEN